MIKHIWFDVAGTLYRETPKFNAAHDALRYKTYADVAGQSDPQKAKREFDALYKSLGTNSAVFTSLGKPSDYWQLAFETMDLNGVIAPDIAIIQTIRRLSNTLPISLFTNFKTAKIQGILSLLHIPEQLFTNILSGDDVHERKPAPEGFQKIVELSALFPSEILYVGDRVDADIKPALAAGMHTCLVWQKSTLADYSIDDFTELVDIVKRSQ